MIWRYDPIIITPNTGFDYHAAAFERLAGALRGKTFRVVVSIVDLYRKTDRRMSALAEEGFGIDAEAERKPEMRSLLRHIAETAQRAGMEAVTCAEEADLSALGLRHGSCIDGELVRSLGGHPVMKKDPGQRDACRCVVSRDIGVNDTCLHGCRYCYATRSDEVARRRHSEHDPASPALWGDVSAAMGGKDERQLTLV